MRRQPSKTKARQRKHAVDDLTIKMIGDAVDKIADARTLLRGAEAHAAANYVAKALKSAEGAFRHALRMRGR